MNPPVSYRAWDRHNKRMVNVTAILYTSEEIDHDENLGEPIMWYHFDLMQQTPYKDKAGNVLWEGDKVCISLPPLRQGGSVRNHVGIIQKEDESWLVKCNLVYRLDLRNLQHASLIKIGHCYE